jgi:hypothetical protein
VEETMKYVAFICEDESAELSPAEEADIQASTESWVTEMESRGIRVLGQRLQPVSDATTVRVRGGEVLVADGPFAETKEQIGGFDIIDCADLDQALEVMSRHPMARFGTIEMRPFWQP